MPASPHRWGEIQHQTIRFNYENLALAVNSARKENNLAVSLYQQTGGLIALSGTRYPITPILKPVGRGSIYALAFSPDGSLLATGGKDCFVRLIEAESNQEIKNHKASRNFFVDSVAFSPDSRYLYFGVGNNDVRVWDVRTWTEINKYKISTGVVNALAVSPDGRLLAVAGGNGVVHLLNTSTGAAIAELRGHTYPLVGLRVGVRRVVFSPDGRLLASAGSDKTVRLWEVSSGRNLAVLNHDGGVWGVDFSPDGSSLVSGGDDKTVRFWDIASQRLVGGIKAGDSIMATCFFNDQYVFAASKDKNIYILSPK